MKIKKILLLALACSLYGCTPTQTNTTSATSSASSTPVTVATSQPTPKEEATSKFLIVPGQSIGVVDQSSSKDALVAHYGADSVKDASVYVGEGLELPGLSLFSEDPKRMVEMIWSEDDPGKLMLVRIEGEESVWKTKEGVTLGTTLLELEKLNGKPFAFTGLDWDLGGWVTDWKGGELEGLSARFGSTDGSRMSDEDMNAIVGDKQVMSSHEAAQRINPKLNQISVNF